MSENEARAFDPLPPHNSEAEESVLGSLMIDPDGMATVIPYLPAGDFYHPNNRLIYVAMVRLHQRHEPTDYVMVCDELQRTDDLGTVGGMGYVSRLLTVVPTSIHLEHYARIVLRTAIMRRLIAAAGRIAAIAYEDNPDIDSVLERATVELLRVTRTASLPGSEGPPSQPYRGAIAL